MPNLFKHKTNKLKINNLFCSLNTHECGQLEFAPSDYVGLKNMQLLVHSFTGPTKAETYTSLLYGSKDYMFGESSMF